MVMVESRWGDITDRKTEIAEQTFTKALGEMLYQVRHEPFKIDGVTYVVEDVDGRIIMKRADELL